MSINSNLGQAQTTSNVADIANPKVCRLVIDDIHFSTSAYKQTGKKYLKIKARSECYMYQSSVQIILQIFQVDTIHGDKLLQTFNNYKIAKSGYLIEIKDAQLPCVNNKLNQFYGIAKSHVVIPGHGVFDRQVQSPISPATKCGIS